MANSGADFMVMFAAFIHFFSLHPLTSFRSMWIRKMCFVGNFSASAMPFSLGSQSITKTNVQVNIYMLSLFVSTLFLYLSFHFIFFLFFFCRLQNQVLTSDYYMYLYMYFMYKIYVQMSIYLFSLFSFFFFEKTNEKRIFFDFSVWIARTIEHQFLFLI